MRGYRKNPHKAPLREDLAFALLMAGGLKPNWNMNALASLIGKQSSKETAEPVHLFDPLCGSGTIAIEGAGMLAGLPPGRNSLAPLQGTLFFNNGLWHEIKNAALSVSSLEDNNFMVTANDKDKTAIEAARVNAKEAGVLDCVDFTLSPFQKHPIFSSLPSRNLLLVTNPPYGHRMSGPAIYKKLANSISKMPCETNTTRYAVLGNDPRPIRETGLQPIEVKFSSKSGGISVVAMAGEKEL
jgi:putative N6-adenine-specific DNA methylase